MIFTANFWALALERALKTAAQSVLGLWGVADAAFNLLQVDWQVALGAAVTGAALSILTSIVSAPYGPNPADPSLV